MTVDREQIRRDAEWLAGTDFNVAADRLAVAVPALLAELEQAERRVGELESAMASVHVGDLMDRLEQAERERDGFAGDAWTEEQLRKDAEAQLAKVPALVEALQHYAMRGHWSEGERKWVYDGRFDDGYPEPWRVADEALAAFEQEQNP